MIIKIAVLVSNGIQMRINKLEMKYSYHCK